MKNTKKKIIKTFAILSILFGSVSLLNVSAATATKTAGTTKSNSVTITTK